MSGSEKRPTRFRVAIAVHGKFHAFDLASALANEGAEVTVFSNYPIVLARRQLPTSVRYRGFAVHGAFSRAVRTTRIHSKMEAALHRAFGRWVASELRSWTGELVLIFSGVAEEALADRHTRIGRQMHVVRGSSHILRQYRLLEEESRRCGRPIAIPSQWMIDRESREYGMADRVQVLSKFAKKSFDELAPDVSVYIAPMGTDVGRFLLSESAKLERLRRLRNREKLSVIFAGTLSFRKGLVDLLACVATLDDAPVRFVFVGDVPAECRATVGSVSRKVEVVGRIPQGDLARYFSEADVFYFPTIEDGYAAVLIQASAAGLPLLTTPNCGGPDLIEAGAPGWVVPVRSPEGAVTVIRNCVREPDTLAAMLESRLWSPISWTDAAKSLLKTWQSQIEQLSS